MAESPEGSAQSFMNWRHNKEKEKVDNKVICYTKGKVPPAAKFHKLPSSKNTS